MATGAVSRPMSTPEMPGPAICAAERLISSLELPSRMSSRSTSDGRYDWYATSKKTVRQPATKPTTYNCQMVRTPSM